MAQKKLARVLAEPSSLLPPEEDDVWELDEMWTFVGNKANEKWLWAVLCRRARQVVGWCIGDRSILTGYAFHKGIDQKCETVSDLWQVYEPVFDPNKHTSAQKKVGLTNHIEHFWNQLRQRLGRFVRRTLSFSKTPYWLTASLWLFIEQYNREISSLFFLGHYSK